MKWHHINRAATVSFRPLRELLAMTIDRKQANRLRILPKVTYTNYRKKFPNTGGCFKSWFSVNRYWGGRIISISVKHRELSFDFRGNFLADMCYPQG